MIARLAVLFTLLFLPFTFTGCFIPTDRDLEVKLTDALRHNLRPQSVKVSIYRRSIFSTTVRKLDVSLSGFSTDNIPLMKEQAAAPAPAPTATTGAGAALAKPVVKKKKSTEIKVRIVNANIHCDHFEVKSIPVLSLDLAIRDIFIPLRGDDIKIESGKSAICTVAFDEQGLTQFLRSRNHLPVNDAKVRLTKDGCIVTGKIKAFFNTPVELSGRILVKDQAVLYIDQPKVRVSALTLPGFVTERLLKDINPIADLNTDFDFPVPITVSSLTHDDGKLTFVADLHLPQPKRRR